MGSGKSVNIRKLHIAAPSNSSASAQVAAGLNELDLVALATIHYSSEDPDHPVEHMFDGCSGRGATRWMSARCDATEQIVIAFTYPVNISRMAFEVEETLVGRTQEVRVEYSADAGRTYRQVLVQEYTFSPQGSTCQQENLALELRDVTHLRLIIVPNKGGSGKATITSLQLFA